MKARPGRAFAASRALAAASLAAAALATLSGCEMPWDDGRTAGSEIGNPTLDGVALYPEGRPVAGARVYLRPKDYLARDIGESLIRSEAEPHVLLAKRSRFLADIETDSRGRFVIADVDTGSYFLEVGDELGRGVRLAVEVKPKDRRIDLGAATVQPTAAIRGILRTSEPTPALYLAWVQGLERAALVNPASGEFTLQDVPAGEYTLHLGCLDRGCLSKDVPGVKVEPGVDTRLDTLTVGTFITEKYSAWRHSLRITLNTTPTGGFVADTVHDFPLLVRLDSANFPWAGADARGRDVRFADTLGNNLHFEIERWDSADRRAEIWVRMPAVYGDNQGQALTMYWGNDSAASYSSGPEVFPRSEGFRGVWHLQENAGRTPNGFRDATFNGNHGTGSAALPAARDGAIGLAQPFDGVSSVEAAEDSSLHVDSGLTIELWANPRTLGQYKRLVSKAHSAARYPWTEYGIEIDSTGSKAAFAVGLRDSLFSVRSERPLTTGSWVHIVGTYDGSHLRIFLDGVLEGAVERKGPITDRGQDLLFGKYEHDNASNYNGALDEIRISDRARSPAWIRLSYESQRPGSKLLTFSAPK